jgi:predicted LPLAT superfamily acyltransferase
MNEVSMSEWKGKTRGGVFGYGLFIFLLRHFGLGVAYVVLRFVALYFVFFSPRAFSNLYRFHRIALGYGRVLSVFTVYRNYFALGQSLLDKIVVLSGLPHKFVFEHEDEHHIEEMIRGGKGGILLGAHAGNWEIAGQLLNRLESTFHIVLLDAEHQRIKKLLENAGATKNFPVIPIKGDLTHIFEINTVFENKEFLCIHGDRFLDDSRTVDCTFFGAKGRFPYGVFYLAVRYQVPVSFVFAMKTGRNSYHLFATPPKNFGEIGESGDRDAANEYAVNLETMVQAYPTQWFNYHDIFAAG